jgi:thiamine biosynthesis lipoprotein
MKKILLLSVLLSFLSGCQARELYTDNRVLMGTFIEVTSPSREAAKIVFAEFERIEKLLSKYMPESEISKLNAAGKLKVSLDTFYIIKKAKEFWQASDGAFDITVAPLLDLWGFTDQRYYVPTAEEIANILKLVGSDKIILNERDNVVEFMTPGMKLDLGGIAKGYALDCAVKKLKTKDLDRCLINAGGQVYALGDKFGKPWRIGVRNPRSGGVSETLELRKMSVSTSGGYEQFFIQKGKRYVHILNPKTGFPAESKILSVTIMAPEGVTADALSTAVFVLGKEKGQKLIEKFKGVQLNVIEE